MVLISNANGSAQVHREVDQAFGRAKTVVPLRIENVKPVDELAFYLDTVHWLDALSPPLERNLGQLVTTVLALLSVQEQTPVAAEVVSDDTQAARAAEDALREDKKREEAKQRAEKSAQCEREVVEAELKKQESEPSRRTEDEKRQKEKHLTAVVEAKTGQHAEAERRALDQPHKILTKSTYVIVCSLSVVGIFAVAAAAYDHPSWLNRDFCYDSSVLEKMRSIDGLPRNLNLVLQSQTSNQCTMLLENAPKLWSQIYRYTVWGWPGHYQVYSG